MGTFRIGRSLSASFSAVFRVPGTSDMRIRPAAAFHPAASALCLVGVTLPAIDFISWQYGLWLPFAAPSPSPPSDRPVCVGNVEGPIPGPGGPGAAYSHFSRRGTHRLVVPARRTLRTGYRGLWGPRGDRPLRMVPRGGGDPAGKRANLSFPCGSDDRRIIGRVGPLLGRSAAPRCRVSERRVRSWLRMNAGGAPNTCKSNGNRGLRAPTRVANG